MEAFKVMEGLADICKELSWGDDKALTQVHPEIAGSQLGSAIGFHNVTRDVATDGAIQIVHCVGRHPNSGPPIPLVDRASIASPTVSVENL